MSNIIINNRKHSIEITKAFEKKASIFGSEEYKQLKEAKLDFPTYAVRVKTVSKRKIENRITLNDIVAYVEKHCGEESKEMSELRELRGTSIKEAEGIFNVEETASFADIKKWFFNTFPELANKITQREERIAEILTEAAAKNAASL